MLNFICEETCGDILLEGAHIMIGYVCKCHYKAYGGTNKSLFTQEWNLTFQIQRDIFTFGLHGNEIKRCKLFMKYTEICIPSVRVPEFHFFSHCVL